MKSFLPRIVFAISILFQISGISCDNGEAATSTTKKITWFRKTEATTAHPNGSKLNLRRMMATPCTTPNDDPGFCISIKECSKLYNQLGNPNATKFLRQSSCAPYSENILNPKVCCGKYDNFKHLIKQNPLPKKCGTQKVKNLGRIVGGVTAKLGEFPWMARLMHRNVYKYKMFGCSGFLISSKFVLTAAHCLSANEDNPIGPLFEVHLGEHDTETDIDCHPKGTPCADPIQIIRVKETVIHPDYDRESKNYHHDIGLVHLRKSANFTDWVYPICLQAHYNDVDSALYWISGWGKTERYEASNVKMKLQLKQYPHDDCVEKYDNIDVEITSNQICAGSEKMKDSCSGDSGGPLMSLSSNNTFYADGIVSYGIGCGRQGWPGVYTKIPSYLDWIKDEMLKRMQPKPKRRSAQHL